MIWLLFRKIFAFQFFFFDSYKKCQFFSNFQIFRIITAQTTFFENTNYNQINSYYGFVSAKTSYSDSIIYFWKIFPFQISFFKKKPCFFKFLNCRIITAQTIYFESIQYSKIYFHYGFVLGKLVTMILISFERYIHLKFLI